MKSMEYLLIVFILGSILPAHATLNDTCPTKTNTDCQVFPTTRTYACSIYIGNQLSYNKEKIDQYNEDLQSAINLIRVVLGNSTCADLLFSLMCSHLHPKCQNIPLLWTDVNKTKPQPQKICAETCRHLHYGVCKNDLNQFGEMVRQFASITISAEVKSLLTELLIYRCNDTNVFPTTLSNPAPECLLITDRNEFQKNDTCDGNGFDYAGNINKTKFNQTCLPWSSACLKQYSLLDISGLNENENFCRNPSGYKEIPWCYISPNGTEWQYCDVPKCPVINGNYSQWSDFGACIGKCGSERYKSRFRTCSSPEPKYGGNNCSLLGPSDERLSCGILECKVNSDSPVTYVAYGIAAGVVVITGIILAIFIYRKKPKNIIAYDQTVLNPETIDILIKRTEEDSMLVQQIYEHLKLFRHCLCSNCIKDWLISLLHDSMASSPVDIPSNISTMMQRLEEYQSKYNNLPDVLNNCHNEKSHNYRDDHENCFYENVVKEWVQECVQYSKLGPMKDGESDDNSQRALAGAFMLKGDKIVPVYDTLLSSRKNVEGDNV
ncbi:uncharacterized protein LOC130614207 [Hydractinia symbiolongicarpus]|uniref:uncharacterized protein LOC130614207 n=1 Tax=Hydractinia symbiolongicarpus TaxID=13093 RepID=UPI00254C1FD0|nr:uncharacterized protein LOC130614207 [Hydractinia symbiolongicarpus]